MADGLSLPSYPLPDEREREKTRMTDHGTADGPGTGGTPSSRVSASWGFTLRTPGLPPVSFNVVPGSRPPSRIHVVTGANGTGKTRLLNLIAALASGGDRTGDSSLEFRAGAAPGSTWTGGKAAERPLVLAVSFSALDPPPGSPSCPGCARIGIWDAAGARLKSAGELASEFAASTDACLNGPRRQAWLQAMTTIEYSDQALADEQVSALADPCPLPDPDDEPEPARPGPRETFAGLGAGHQAAVLSLAQIAEHVQGRSLVLIDSPESYLSLPLQTAFTRALDALLDEHGSAAVLATGSPVIMQDVPRDCTWILRRDGRAASAARPGIETWGENTGTIFRQVLGLDPMRSGYRQAIDDAARANPGYNATIRALRDLVGSEGRAYAMVTARREPCGPRPGGSSPGSRAREPEPEP